MDSFFQFVQPFGVAMVWLLVGCFVFFAGVYFFREVVPAYGTLVTEVVRSVKNPKTFDSKFILAVTTVLALIGAYLIKLAAMKDLAPLGLNSVQVYVIALLTTAGILSTMWSLYKATERRQYIAIAFKAVAMFVAVIALMTFMICFP